MTLMKSSVRSTSWSGHESSPRSERGQPLGKDRKSNLDNDVQSKMLAATPQQSTRERIDKKLRQK